MHILLLVKKYPARPSEMGGDGEIWHDRNATPRALSIRNNRFMILAASLHLNIDIATS